MKRQYELISKLISSLSFSARRLFVLLLVAFIGVQPQLAQADEVPVLVKDINTTFANSLDENLRLYSKPVEIGNSIYFCAKGGNELWKSDGNTAVIVKKIYSGSRPYAISCYLTKANGMLFFKATDGISGYELWKSDGTESGTEMVKDIQSGSSSSSPMHLKNIGGVLYFSADDGSYGRELWKSDGTESGTIMVKDILHGEASSNPSDFVSYKGSLFFSAKNDLEGRELWRSNGTEDGTVMVKDINSHHSSSNPSYIITSNGSLYFAANDGIHGKELWVSDGTESGTFLVKDIKPGSLGSNPAFLTSFNGFLGFRATDGISGREIWKSDGTVAGTTLVKDIYPGGGSSVPYNLSIARPLIATKDHLYFIADDSVHGLELWKTNGTEVGTVMIKDIRPDLSHHISPSAISFTNVNGVLYFIVSNDTREGGLWKSDGTESGTIQVANLAQGHSLGSSYTHLTHIGGTLYFSLNVGNNKGFWKSDGTEASTVEIPAVTISHTNSSNLMYITDIGGEVIFSANDGIHGSELWRTNGTESGTVLVKDINPGLYSSRIFNLTHTNGIGYFAANGDGGVSSYGDLQLWKTDASEEGTVLVNDIKVQSLININETLFFRGDDGIHGRELWKSDGTQAGTVLVKNISSRPEGSVPSRLTNVNGTLYFSASDNDSGAELWKSDGTEAGTVLVRDINPGAPNASLDFLINTAGTLYFSADDGVNGKELWKSDGTESGTVLVKNIRLGSSVHNAPASSSPRTMVNVNGTTFFSANDGVHGRELWKSDGTEAGTVIVRNIHSGSVGSSPKQMTQVGGVLYFSANDGVHGRELWKSDGTEAGTVMVSDIRPGLYGSIPERIINVNGILYFSADDHINGRELWRSDGTEAGTALYYDINVGSGSSEPAEFTYSNDNLYFRANDRVHGNELWKLAINSTPVEIISPVPGDTLTGSGEVFTLDLGSVKISQWWLYAGSTVGGYDYFVGGENPVASNSITVTGLPTDGSTVYVRVWYQDTVGDWHMLDATYTSSVSFPAEINSPAPGDNLSGASEVFTWSSGSVSVRQWWLYAGSTEGGYDYFYGGNNPATTNSMAVTGLPTDGSVVHIRIWYQDITNAWYHIDAIYTAAALVSAEITSPIPGSILVGENETFIWSLNGINVNQWWLYAGSTVGSFDYFFGGDGSGTSTTIPITGLPTDGSIVYLRLWYQDTVSGWHKLDASYTAIATK